jgi:hypothetical protein
VSLSLIVVTLKTVLSELTALGVDEVPLRVGPPPDVPGWVTLQALVGGDRAAIGAVVEEVAGLHTDGHRDVAVIHACAWLTELLLWPLLTSLVLRSRAWHYESGMTTVHRVPGEFWDAISLSESPVALVGDDPLVREHPHDKVVLDDHRAVVDWAAGHLSPLLFTIVRELSACGPFGRRGLWATIAGEATCAALVAAHRVHADDRHALATASYFLDTLVRRTGERIPRPPVQSVLVSLGHRLAPTKAACCLRFKVSAYATRRDPLCLTCPRRSEVDRDAIYTQWIERLCRQRLT